MELLTRIQSAISRTELFQRVVRSREEEASKQMLSSALDVIIYGTSSPERRMLSAKARENIERQILHLWNFVTRDGIQLLELVSDPYCLALACADYAITRDCFSAFKEYPIKSDLYHLAIRQKSKTVRWNTERLSMKKREWPRVVHMQLYPRYFHLIANSIKTVEGRAYKPDSDKLYPGIQAGDVIFFTVCQETGDWLEECHMFDISPDTYITASVNSTHHAPLIQWVFHDLEPPDGRQFQPGILPEYDEETRAIFHAAQYYEIPYYPLLISRYGFIGIELGNIEVHI